MCMWECGCVGEDVFMCGCAVHTHTWSTCHMLMCFVVSHDQSNHACVNTTPTWVTFYNTHTHTPFCLSQHLGG